MGDTTSMPLFTRRTLLRALAWTAPTLAIGGLVPVAQADDKPQRRFRFMPKVYGTPIIGGLDPMGPSPLTLLRDNTDVTVVNTVTKTALFTYPVPAYTLDGDRGLRVSADVGLLNTSAVSAPDAIFTLSLGTTDMIEWEFPGISIGVPFVGRLVFEVMAKNSDAIQEVFATALIGQDVAGTTAGEGGSVASNGSGAFYGEATEDGTTDLDLKLAVTLSDADPDLAVTLRRVLVELL